MQSLEEWFEYTKRFDFTEPPAEPNPPRTEKQKSSAVEEARSPVERHPVVKSQSNGSQTGRLSSAKPATARLLRPSAPPPLPTSSKEYPGQPTFRPAPDTQPRPTPQASQAPATRSTMIERPSDQPFGRTAPVAKPRQKPELPAEKESREQLLSRLLDPVLTLEEAAQVLNVCPTTVRRYTNKGLLKHYRTSGNQRRFRLSHVLHFLGESGGSLENSPSGTIETEGAVKRTRGRRSN